MYKSEEFGSRKTQTISGISHQPLELFSLLQTDSHLLWSALNQTDVNHSKVTATSSLFAPRHLFVLSEEGFFACPQCSADAPVQLLHWNVLLLSSRFGVARAASVTLASVLACSHTPWGGNPRCVPTPGSFTAMRQAPRDHPLQTVNKSFFLYFFFPLLFLNQLSFLLDLLLGLLRNVLLSRKPVVLVSPGQFIESAWDVFQNQ